MVASTATSFRFVELYNAQWIVDPEPLKLVWHTAISITPREINLSEPGAGM